MQIKSGGQVRFCIGFPKQSIDCSAPLMLTKAGLIEPLAEAQSCVR